MNAWHCPATPRHAAPCHATGLPNRLSLTRPLVPLKSLGRVYTAVLAGGCRWVGGGQGDGGGRASGRWARTRPHGCQQHRGPMVLTHHSEGLLDQQPGSTAAVAPRGGPLPQYPPSPVGTAAKPATHACRYCTQPRLRVHCTQPRRHIDSIDCGSRRPPGCVHSASGCMWCCPSCAHFLKPRGRLRAGGGARLEGPYCAGGAVLERGPRVMPNVFCLWDV